MPNSPVNLLSLWQLAEQYCNKKGTQTMTAQASTCLTMLTLCIGIKSNFQRHFILQTLVFRSAFSPWDTIDCRHLLHTWRNIITTLFIGHSPQKSRIIHWHLSTTTLLSQWSLREACHSTYQLQLIMQCHSCKA